MKSFDVAVMHDYFVDRLVYTSRTADLFALAKSKAREGGGSIHGVRQEDIRGGNAVNLANALSRLGARVLLITHSDSEHLALLEGAFEGTRVEVRVKPLAAGLTVAIEERVNVMMSDSGGASDFPSSILNDDDWDCLGRSKVVCSVNWAANRHGTSLLLALRLRLGREATLFLNPSDVRDRLEEYARLVGLMRRKHPVDWLSVNRFEAEATAGALGVRKSVSARLCSDLSSLLGARVDLHTESASFTSHDGKAAARKTHWLRPRRLTGAGDVWDAASIFGFLRGMDDGERLGFANTAARLYVKGEVKGPPTFAEVSRALA